MTLYGRVPHKCIIDLYGNGSVRSFGDSGLEPWVLSRVFGPESSRNRTAASDEYEKVHNNRNSFHGPYLTKPPQTLNPKP